MEIKPITIGFIGAGAVARMHLHALKQDDRADIRWLVDPNPDALRELAAEYDIPHTGDQYPLMLEDKDLDLVIVATPPQFHVDLAVDALKAGKHVVVEKPLALCEEEADRLLQAAVDHPDRVCMDCSGRHSRLQPKYEYVKNLINAGAIGDVYHVHHSCLRRSVFLERNPRALWSVDKEMAGGGALINWGVYDLSFHLGLLDDRPRLADVRSFTKSGLKPLHRKHGATIEDHGAAFMRFDTGMTYYYERGDGVQYESPNKTVLYGTGGTISFAYLSWDGPELTLYTVDGDEERREELTIPIEDSDDNLWFIRHYLDCVQGKAQPILPLEIAIKHMHIIFRILGNA